MTITVPSQLRKGGYRFVKLRAREKIPIEQEWQKTANYDDKGIAEWIAEGNNYGVLCGDGLIVVDTDTPEAEKLLAEKLPPTFKVKTAKGYHRYYLCYGFPNMKFAGGDIKSTGGQVVGPSCVHPSGANYEVAEDRDIALITKKELLEWLGPLAKISDGSGVDVAELLKPKSQGERDDSAFKLAAFHRRAEMSQEDSLQILRDWNKTNKPPLDDAQIVKVVRSAFRGEAYRVRYKQDPTKRPEAARFEPLWGEKLHPVNPALDFVDGVAYITQHNRAIEHYRKQVRDKDGKMKLVDAERRVFIPWVITSEREKYALIPDETDELPFIPSSIPQHLKHRGWSQEKLKAFLDGEAEAVSFEDAFKKIRGQLEYYHDLPDPALYDYFALWVMGTWFHPLFNAYPEIFLNAIKRSGKTKLLEMLALMSFNGKLVLTPSDSTMFRLAQNNRCTILIDEMKRMRGPAEENLRSMIRGRYKKGVAVPRVEEKQKGKGFEVNDYELYGPLGMANIRGLENDMEDRTHSIVLRRTLGPQGNREIDYLAPEWVEIRDTLYLLTLTRFKDVDAARVEVDSVDRTVHMENDRNNADKTAVVRPMVLPSGVSIYLPLLSTQPSITNRARELWRPILVMASLISRECAERMLDLAGRMTHKAEVEDTTDNSDLNLVRVLIGLIETNEEARSRVESGRYLRWMRALKIREVLIARFYPSAPDWLSPIMVGLACKRLGVYEDKRQVKGRTEMLISEAELRKTAASMKIDWDEEVAEYRSWTISQGSEQETLLEKEVGV